MNPANIRTLNAQNILLIGLPGSGKSRVANVLKSDFDCEVLSEKDVLLKKQAIEFTRPGVFEWQAMNNGSELVNMKTDSNTFIWCVVDVRSVLSSDESAWANVQLRNQLAISDGVVFTFTEQSALDDQAWWNRWVAQHTSVQLLKTQADIKPINEKPANTEQPTKDQTIKIARMLNNHLPVNFSGFEKRSIPWVLSQKKSSDSSAYSSIICFEVPLKRVLLDHLLMVLDNAKQSLGMNITRVFGTVQTLEYQNLVAIEGTPNRLDTFAAKVTQDIQGNSSVLILCGVDLNQKLLIEMIQACQK